MINRKIFFSFFFFFLMSHAALANNLVISNVTLEDRDAAADTAIVQFDIAWDGSWRSTVNHDAVWIFLKGTSGGLDYHGMMKDSGVNPIGTSPGSNEDLEIYVPTDKTGAFIRRKSTGSGGVGSLGVRLNLNYAASPLSATDSTSLTVKVIGIEMVFIPTGAFRAGDTSATATLKQGSADTDPWYISSEATILVNNAASNAYFYQSNSKSWEVDTRWTFTIPAAFPKGYAAFYCMKYEITEGQWKVFIDSIYTATGVAGDPAQALRDITTGTNSGKNADSVTNRNTISQTQDVADQPSTITTNRPDRAVNYLSWMDLCAFLDWAALRPMTELEYEKVARGNLTSVTGEYAWGSTSITAAVVISTSPESGLETITTANANANYNATTFSRGDDYLGSSSATGPLRSGIFATSSSTRATSGAGYYGVMELSGNLSERVITIGNSRGVQFTGNHGDGILSSVLTFAGNANTNWPHTDTQSFTRGVTKAWGSGFKGGDYTSAAAVVQISDRSVAASRDDARNAAYGGRGVRTYDGP